MKHILDSDILSVVRRIRENCIPPGPFLGGRIWSRTENQCIELVRELIETNRDENPVEPRTAKGSLD